MRRNKLPAHPYLYIMALIQWVLGFSLVNAQYGIPGKPYPLTYTNCPDLKVYDIVADWQAVEKSMLEDTGIWKPANQGTLIQLKYNTLNAGTWDTLQNGTKIWRMAFHVEGAGALDLIFSPYRVEKGVSIFVFNRNQQFIAGAFSEKNNKTFNMLATSQIPGDFIILEIQVPSYVDSLGSFGISGIGCELNNPLKSKSASDQWHGLSGPCNIDVNCSSDAMIQQVKYAVVRIIFNGTQRCTGTLVNTTRHDGINYILTAGHCFTNKYGKPDEAGAHSAVFYFDYESPFCEGSDGNSAKSLSGSTIRAFSNDVDFALLELFEPVPYSYHPFYAGWDHSGKTVTSAKAVHHPLGDVKKIAIENDPLIVSSVSGGYDAGKHFLVRNWEAGTTENGSSGCPLFDNSGHIVGTLTGGEANCVNSVNDYFAMFSHSWNDYSDHFNQLAFWLDPSNASTNTLDGFDPYSEFWKSGDTLTNFITGDSVKLETGSLLWGSYSGNNSDHLKSFADHFSTSRDKQVLGVILNVINNTRTSNASLTLRIWKNLDQEGILYQKEIPLTDLVAGVYNFVGFDTAVYAGNDFFAGFELNYTIPGDTSSFAVGMAASRNQTAVNTAWVSDGVTWKTLADYTGNQVNSSFAIFPVVYDSIPQTKGPLFTDDLMIYPNPAKNRINVFFNEIVDTPVQISIYNIQGGLVKSLKYGAYQHNFQIELPAMVPGIYLVQLNFAHTNRIVKLSIVK